MCISSPVAHRPLERFSQVSEQNLPAQKIGFTQWRGHRFIALGFRLGLGGLFLFACFHKIIDPADFALSVATYGILPDSTINLMAIILPWVELISGIMIVVGFKSRAASLLIFGMLLMFTISLSFALSKGLDMSCGCFAASDAGDSISRLTFVRDLFLTAMALYVLVLDRSPLGVDSLRTKPFGEPK